jgi:hypothetical protein
MEGNVEHRYIGTRLEKVKCLVQKFFRKQKSKCRLSENLKTTQSTQNSYADNRIRELTFEVGDYVYLKVSPMRGMKRFKVKDKLSPRYIGLFQILERKGEVTHQLELLD